MNAARPPFLGFLALTIVAALFLALPAAAAAGAFDSRAEYPLTLSGSPTTTPVFTVQGNKAECSSESLSGTMSETSEALTAHPTFSECTAFGFVSATITTTGCDFAFNLGEEEKIDLFAGSTDVVCESGKAIKIAVATCEVQIGSQSGLSGVQFEDAPAAAPPYVSALFAITKLKYTVTKSGFLCPLSTGSAENGKFSGTLALKGSVGGGGVELLARPKTVFCKKEEQRCVPLEIRNAGAELQGSAMNAELEFMPLPGQQIECAASLVGAKTLEQEKTPLKTELTELTFGECETEGVACNANVSAPNVPEANGGVVGFDDKRSGDWKLKKLELSFECPIAAVQTKCEFSAANRVVEIAGGKPAFLYPSKTILARKAGQPAACPTGVVWTGIYRDLKNVEVFVSYK